MPSERHPRESTIETRESLVQGVVFKVPLRRALKVWEEKPLAHGQERVTRATAEGFPALESTQNIVGTQ